MSLIERILCPIDPESPAYSALKYSFALAERFHASIDVVHARTPEHVCWFASSTDGVVSDQRLRTRLEKTLSTVPSGIPGRATARIIEGRPLEALLSHSRRTRCDLLVVGARRLRGDEVVAPCGTGEAVAHHATCAVLSTRETTVSSSALSIRRILLAVDFSSVTELALDWTTAFARRFGASLQLVHVVHGARPARSNRDPEERLIEIGHRLERQGVRVELSGVCEGAVAESVLESAHSSDCDLIVLGAHVRPGRLDDAVHGVVADVRRRSRVPVLSVRRPRPEALFAMPGYGHQLSLSAASAAAVAPFAARPWARVSSAGEG